MYQPSTILGIPLNYSLYLAALSAWLHVKQVLNIICIPQNVQFQKYPYFPLGRYFLKIRPTSLEIPIKLHYISLYLLALRNPRKLLSLLWGEYGYFMELHVMN